MKEMKKEPLTLNYMGVDDFAMPVYQDQLGHLWKDVDLGELERPCLYSVLGNTFDGDPNMPIGQDFTIIAKKKVVNQDKCLQYQMLDRLKSDCEYYLGYGYRDPKCLWAKSEKDQVEEMKKIWNSFSRDEKPEWLTWSQIEKYERDIVLQKSLIPGTQFVDNKSGLAMKIVKIKSETFEEESSPTTIIREISTERDFSRSFEALKHSDITITRETDFMERENAICKSLMRALLCHQTVTLNLADGSTIQGITEAVTMDCVTIKKKEIFGRIAVVPFEQVNSMFVS